MPLSAVQFFSEGNFQDRSKAFNLILKLKDLSREPGICGISD